jgi:uncharacterized protein
MLTNKEILQTANAAITKGDYEGFLLYCTEDTHWNFIGGKTLKGKQAVREWMKKEYKEPPKFKVEHLIAEDNFVIAVGTIMVSGENYNYCDVWQFRDAKMSGLKAFVKKSAPPL